MTEALDNFLLILNEYWKPFIFWDGTEFSGLAVTLWILVLSLLFGFLLALPLSIARVSKNPWISGPVGYLPMFSEEHRYIFKFF